MSTEINDITPSQFQGKEDLLRKEMIASLDVNVLGVMYSINTFLPLSTKERQRRSLPSRLVWPTPHMPDLGLHLQLSTVR